MSQVLESFRRSVSLTVGNPAHVGVLFVVMLAMAIPSLLLGLIPIVGPIVSNIVVTPLMLAAMLGSANAVRNGQGSLEGAKRGVSDAGLSLMGAYAILYAGFVAVGLAVLMAVILLTIGTATVDASAAAIPGMLGTLGTLALLGVFILVLVVSLAFQFVGPAAVVAGTNAVESVKTSFRFFSRNVLGVVGFSLLLFSFFVAVYALVVVGYFVGAETMSSLAGIGVAGLLGLVCFPFATSVVTFYLVEYFDAVADESMLPESPVSPSSDQRAVQHRDDAPSFRTPDSVPAKEETEFEFVDSGQDGNNEAETDEPQSDETREDET